METINTAYAQDEQFCFRQGGWAKDKRAGLRETYGV